MEPPNRIADGRLGRLTGIEAAGVDFVRLARGHFPLLAVWLSDDNIARWWCHETSIEALEADFGPAMIEGLLKLKWEAEPKSGDVVVVVHADNRPSWRVLEKAEFVHLADGELTPTNPADNRNHRIMGRARPMATIQVM